MSPPMLAWLSTSALDTTQPRTREEKISHATFFWSTTLRFWGDFGSRQGAEIREYATLDKPRDTRWEIRKKRLFPSLKRDETKEKK